MGKGAYPLHLRGGISHSLELRFGTRERLLVVFVSSQCHAPSNKGAEVRSKLFVATIADIARLGVCLNAKVTMMLIK